MEFLIGILVTTVIYLVFKNVQQAKVIRRLETVTVETVYALKGVADEVSPLCQHYSVLGAEIITIQNRVNAMHEAIEGLASIAADYTFRNLGK